MNITAGEDHFNQSLKDFQPPSEHPEESIMSSKRPKPKVKAGDDLNVLSDDSVIRGFLQGEVFKSFEKSSYYAESETTNKLKATSSDKPAYLDAQMNNP